MKTKSTGFALWAILILSVGLTSCVNEPSAPKELSQLYQPPVLRLAAGTVLTTLDGQYKAEANEVWHSDARFRTLEQENINLTAALAQLRARAN